MVTNVTSDIYEKEDCIHWSHLPYEVACLDDNVFAVLCGIPAELWRNTKIDLQDGKPSREVVGSHLCVEISAAIKLVKDSKTRTNDMEEIIKLFD